jgi:predicted dienelactone hydrolase
MPRDYVRRRHFFRHVSNIAIIVVMSVAAAYFITRQSGGPGFSPPASTQKAALSMPPSSPEAALAVGSASPDSSAPPGYQLASGPHAVTEVSDIVLHDAKRNKDLHLRVFYPNEPGNYPVIVFSHGAGGSQT